MRHPRPNSFRYLAPVALLAFVLAIVLSRGSAPLAEADATHAVSGFAWSSDIGWISFNCLDSSGASSPQQNTCGTANYGVDINFTSGNFSGFAWSSSLGYINFAPTPDPGGTGCTSAPCAQLDTAGNVSGWARACAVLTAADCTGTAVKGAGTLGGWDGWIKLADPSWTNPANYGYLGSPGVTYDAGGHHGIYLDPRTAKLKGFAWGGAVVGWIDFAPIVPPAVGGVVVNLPPPIISVTPIQLGYGRVEVNTSKMLTFTITNTAGQWSYLSGTISIPGGTPFVLSSGSAAVTCSSGTSCTYDVIPTMGTGLLNVTFTPPEAGNGQTTQVTFHSGGALADVVKVVVGDGVYFVSGVGSSPGPGGMNFGSVALGRYKDLVLRITNDGVIGLGSNDLSFPFPVYTCIAGCPFTLTPGVPNDVTIRFRPTATTTYDGNATLAAHPSVVFPFTGKGIIGVFRFRDQ